MTPELLIDPVSHRLLVDGEPLARVTFRALVEVDPAHVAPWARIEDHKVDPWSLSAVGVAARTGDLVRTAVEIPCVGDYITVVIGSDWDVPDIWAIWDDFAACNPGEADPKNSIELGSNPAKPGAPGYHVIWVKRAAWEAADEGARRELQHSANALLKSDRREFDEYEPWTLLPLIVLEDTM
jgi:hypothetical protein